MICRSFLTLNMSNLISWQRLRQCLRMNDAELEDCLRGFRNFMLPRLGVTVGPYQAPDYQPMQRFLERWAAARLEFPDRMAKFRAYELVDSFVTVLRETGWSYIAEVERSGELSVVASGLRSTLKAGGGTEELSSRRLPGLSRDSKIATCPYPFSLFFGRRFQGRFEACTCCADAAG